MSFAEIFRLHARFRPAKPALIHGDLTLDYATLDRQIDSVAHALADQQVRRGDILGVALRDTAAHVVVMLALARLGAVLLPIDCRWHDTEKLSVATHFQAGRVLVEPDDTLLAPGWLHSDPAWFAGDAAPYHDALVTSESPMLLSLSSGTTGVPKGPRHTHRQFESRFMVYWINLGFTAQDRFVTATPLYFGGGRGFSLAMLYAGGTLDLFPPPYHPHELAERVTGTGGTAMFLVPTMLRRLLQADLPAPAFPTLKTLVSSGSALFAEERRAVRARLTPNLTELYASTEGGSVSMLSPQEFEARPDSVGRPCFRVSVEIVDAAHQPLPPNEVGLLRYRSPASATAYYVGDSSEAFRDGWYYPGDLGMMDPEGFLYLRGRAKDMIIRGGVNIYPGDIEQALQAMEGVAEAAVIGVPSREYGEEIIAFVVAPATLTEAALLAHCAARLAPYKRPRRILHIVALPKNSGGKVVKTELRPLAAGLVP